MKTNLSGRMICNGHNIDQNAVIRANHPGRADEAPARAAYRGKNKNEAERPWMAPSCLPYCAPSDDMLPRTRSRTVSKVELRFVSRAIAGGDILVTSFARVGCVNASLCGHRMMPRRVPFA